MVTLPDDAEADDLMRHLRIAPADRAATLAARPDPATAGDLWPVLVTRAAELSSTLDAAVPIEGFTGWPALPASTGAVGRHLYVWALLAAAPAVRRLHARRGIPDPDSWATLSTLGDLMADHRKVTGESGVGLFGLWIPPLRFRGADFLLGRHAFTRATLSVGDGPQGHLLMVHVPPTGPLDPDSSERSFGRARRFFPRHYPDEPVAAFTCASWLLDPQLADYLPAGSNILRFQRRFTLLPDLPHPDPHKDDREMLEFAFGRLHPTGAIPDDLLADLPQQTTLQRAFVTHLRDGRHWHKRTGWLPW